jgi:hypothetical protein
MNHTNVGASAYAVGEACGPEALEFVRFCYRRRRVGWPELYDEMCAVAGRGLYQGYGADELATIGIGLGLFQMPGLAGLAARVVAEDVDRRRRTAAAIRASLVDAVAEADGGPEAESIATVVSPGHDAADQRETAEVAAPAHGAVRLALAAGA